MSSLKSSNLLQELTEISDNAAETMAGGCSYCSPLAGKPPPQIFKDPWSDLRPVGII
jgi:hypothetical protein